MVGLLPAEDPASATWVSRMVVDVLLCAPYGLFRSGLRTILEREPTVCVVGEAGDALQLVSMVRSLRPHVLLLDEEAPRLDVDHMMRQFRRPPTVATRTVLMVTGETHVQDVVGWGIQSLLGKNSEAEELVYAIRATAEFGAFLAPALVCDVLGLLGAQRVDTPSPYLRLLTDREREVLRQVADGCSNAEIAQALFVSEATVKYHISHILQKLDLRDRLQAAVFAHRCGLTR